MVARIDALPKGVQFVAAADSIEEYRLDNGLRVVLKCYPLSPVCKFIVKYDYGSRDEKPGKTGIAHFLEHNMFKGTEKFDPRQGNGSNIFKRVGGMNNANTSWDRTVYYEIVPSDRLSLVSAFEADRMRGLLFRDWRPERDVVLKELDEGNDDPRRALFQAVAEAAFPDHAYGIPIIGRRSDVAQLSSEDLIAAYNRYYWPNNAVVILVGGFDRNKALATIAGDFGVIPCSAQMIPQVVPASLATQVQQQRVEVRRPASNAELLMAFHIPGSSHDDIHALDALSRILGGTARPGSRLYEALVERGIAHGCAAYNLIGLEPFAFFVQADVPDRGDPRQVEESIMMELARLADEPVREDELSRIQEANRNGTILAMDDPLKMADLILNVEALGWTWRGVKEYDLKFDAVTPADIQRVAATYFGRERSIAGILIPDDTAAAGAPDEHIVEQPASEPEMSNPVQLPPPSTQKPLAPSVVRQVLPNGVTIQVVRNPGTGSVAVSGVVLAAGGISCPREKPGVASLTASMLSSGSSFFSKQQLAQIFETMGLSFGISADDYHASFDALVPVKSLSLLAIVLADLLSNPTFPERDLRLAIGLRRARLKSMDKSTSARAHLALMRNIYPDGHPLRKPTIEVALKAVEAIDLDDLRVFHKHYNPASTILTVVGDVEPDAVLRLFERQFGGWGAKSWHGFVVPRVDQGQASTVTEFLPGNNMVDIVIGRATNVNRRNPHGYFAAAIANYALGGDIEARLGRAVREANGLTYGIYSSFGDTSFGAAPWQISVSTNPANVNFTLSLVERVIGRYREEGISDREFEDTVNHLAGALPMKLLRSSARMASALCYYESIGLGLAGIDNYVEHLRSVSKQDVNDVIHNIFDLSKCVTALAGTLER